MTQVQLFVKRLLLNLRLHKDRTRMYSHKETPKKIHKTPIKPITCEELTGYLCPGEDLGMEQNEVERRLFCFFNQVHDLPTKGIEGKHPRLPVDRGPRPGPGPSRQPRPGTLGSYKLPSLFPGARRQPDFAVRRCTPAHPRPLPGELFPLLCMPGADVLLITKAKQVNPLLLSSFERVPTPWIFSECTGHFLSEIF